MVEPQNAPAAVLLAQVSYDLPLLVPDELRQVLAKVELGLVRKIVQCGHDVDYTMSVPRDVIELLNLVHATAPLGGNKHPPGPPMDLANMRELRVL